MSTSFPTSLDVLVNPTPTSRRNSPSLSGEISNANDAIEALQAKVGVNGSAVTASLDYRVAALESAGGGGGAVTTTIAALVALRDAAGLTAGGTYLVTDWVTANSLPGPNYVLARAADVDKLDPFVLVHTPGMTYSGVDIGPTHGIFAWDVLATMIELWDGLGNHVYDFGGTGIDDFPWGFPGFANNTLLAPIFTGGYAVTSAAAAAPIVFSNNTMNGGTVDLAGTGVGSAVSRCELSAGVTLTTGPLAQISGSTFANCDVTNSTTATQLNIQDSVLDQGSYTMSDDGQLVINASVLLAANCTASNTGQVVVDTCRVLGGNILCSTTGTAAALVVQNCHLVQSQIDMSGADTGRTVAGSSITGQSSINIATDTVIGAPTAVRNCEISGASTLNVTELGSIEKSRVAMSAILSTGNFAHTSVIIDGDFTVTLTAANTNTLKSKGFSDTV